MAMTDHEKEIVIQTAKELTLNLMDKFHYFPIPGKPITLQGNQDIVEEIGEDFKILVRKVAEGLENLR